MGVGLALLAAIHQRQAPHIRDGPRQSIRDPGRFLPAQAGPQQPQRDRRGRQVRHHPQHFLSVSAGPVPAHLKRGGDVAFVARGKLVAVFGRELLEQRHLARLLERAPHGGNTHVRAQIQVAPEQFESQRQSPHVLDQRLRFRAETPIAGVQQRHTLPRRQTRQGQVRMAREIPAAGGHQHMDASTGRQQRLQRHGFRKVVQYHQARRAAAQAAPNRFELVRLRPFAIHLDFRRAGDHVDEPGNPLVRLHPEDPARVVAVEPMDVFDRELRLAQSPRAGYHPDSLHYAGLPLGKLIVQPPQRIHPPHEPVSQRAVRHPVDCRQRTHRRQRIAVRGRRRIGPHRAAQLRANPGIVFFEEPLSGYVNLVGRLQKPGNLAGAQQQRQYPPLHSRRRPLQLRPLGLHEIRRQHYHQELALVDSLFETDHEIRAPLDRLLVEKAGHAVARQPPPQLPDKNPVLAAVTEKNAGHD